MHNVAVGYACKPSLFYYCNSCNIQTLVTIWESCCLSWLFLHVFFVAEMVPLVTTAFRALVLQHDNTSAILCDDLGPCMQQSMQLLLQYFLHISNSRSISSLTLVAFSVILKTGSYCIKNWLTHCIPISILTPCLLFGVVIWNGMCLKEVF